MRKMTSKILVFSVNERRVKIKSTQAINLKKHRTRNAVAFEANNPTPLFINDRKTRGFIVVDFKGAANPNDAIKLDFKFDQCRLAIIDSPVDVQFSVGNGGANGVVENCVC